MAIMNQVTHFLWWLLFFGHPLYVRTAIYFTILWQHGSCSSSDITFHYSRIAYKPKTGVDTSQASLFRNALAVTY